MVQTHLTDDEIPDEEETPAVVSTKSSQGAVSIGSSQRPTTTQRPTTQRPTTAEPAIVPGERKTAQKPAVKTSPRIVTTTASSVISESDEEELDEENAVVGRKPEQPAKKPVVETPARKAPTQPVRPQVSGGGTKTKTSVPKVSPRIVTTTAASRPAPTEEGDEEGEIVTTRKPIVIVQPRKPIGTKTPSRPTGGVKTKAAPKPQTVRPAVTTQRPVVTTQRPAVTTEESEESEDETLPTTRAPAPKGKLK